MICGKDAVSRRHLHMSLTFLVDREIEIIYGLAQRILFHQQLVKTCSDICGELDW
jgi:hypothetical protein